MAGPPNANEIKSQLATLLTPIIGTAGTKKTKIIDNLQFAFKEGEDPSNLRSLMDEYVLFEGEGTQFRVNCLMISEAGFGQSPPPRDSTLLLTQSRGKKIITRRFRLTLFYQMGDGSENRASDIMELTRVTLNRNPKLGFAVVDDYNAGPAQFIEGHNGLQVGNFIPEAFGMVLVHVGEGLLEVRVIEPQETI